MRFFENLSLWLCGLRLRPNCLLTRFPIVFLGSFPKDFLRPGVATVLRAHGYEVLTLEHRALRVQLPPKFHLVVAASGKDLDWVALEGLETLTWTHATPNPEAFLPLAISLAEGDLKWSH